jgi:hypothetical protein
VFLFSLPILTNSIDPWGILVGAAQDIARENNFSNKINNLYEYNRIHYKMPHLQSDTFTLNSFIFLQLLAASAKDIGKVSHPMF